MSTSECIPFINTAYDCNATSEFYSDAVAVRINMETIGKTRAVIPSGPKRWIDASIDGLHYGDLSKLTEAYQTHLNKFEDSQAIADPAFQQELDGLLHHYCGRPTPLYFAKRLSATADRGFFYLVRLFGVFEFKEVGYVEERIALQAHIDKGGLHTGQDAGDAPVVDGPCQGVLVFAFVIDFRELIVF